MVVGIAIAVAVAGLPSRQPPDPFEDDHVREIRLHIEWELNSELDPPRERTMRVLYAVGDDVADLRLFQSESPWEHVTTAQRDTFIELAASSSDPGGVECIVYIDGEEAGRDETDDIEGCLVEVLA